MRLNGAGIKACFCSSGCSTSFSNLEASLYREGDSNNGDDASTEDSNGILTAGKIYISCRKDKSCLIFFGSKAGFLSSSILYLKNRRRFYLFDLCFAN